MDPQELGRQVVKRRKAQGMSQEVLSRRADISRNYVSLIERGEAHNVSLNILNQLAMALGATPGELTGTAGQDEILIPPPLRDFGIADGLSLETVIKLLKIPRRGKEPRTVDEWRRLYEAISSYLEDDEDEEDV